MCDVPGSGTWDEKKIAMALGNPAWKYFIWCFVSFRLQTWESPIADGQARSAGTPARPELDVLTRASLEYTSAACIFAAEHEQNNLATELFQPNFAYLILNTCMCLPGPRHESPLVPGSFLFFPLHKRYFFQGRARQRLLPTAKFQQKQKPDDVTYFRTRDRLESISTKPGNV